MVIKALASDGSNAERETPVSATSDDVLAASNALEQTLLCFISGLGCLIPIGLAARRRRQDAKLKAQAMHRSGEQLRWFHPFAREHCEVCYGRRLAVAAK